MFDSKRVGLRKVYAVRTACVGDHPYYDSREILIHGMVWRWRGKVWRWIGSPATLASCRTDFTEDTGLGWSARSGASGLESCHEDTSQA